MQIENSRDRYGSIAQALHWSVALLFIGSFASVYGRRWFTEANTPTNLTALQIHLSIGLSVIILAGLRLWWRWRSRVVPDELPGSAAEHVASRVVHGTLYALMLFMPLTGYLGTGIATELFGLVTVPRFADTTAFSVLVERPFGIGFEQLEKPADWLHKTLGEVAVLVLVGVHVAAALFHQLVRKDGIFARMAPILPRKDH